MQGDDDAEESLAGEGDEDACADFGCDVAERVGEGTVERDREGDIGEEGHELQLSVRSCALDRLKAPGKQFQPATAILRRHGIRNRKEESCGDEYHAEEIKWSVLAN